MDWARDHLGNDVPAWQGGISAFGLVCPSCGEPVRRRAGLERRPHFAHYSHRAKPQCENYFPSSGFVASDRNTPAPKERGGGPTNASLNCGLFLGASGVANALSLWLRVPSIASESTQMGTLRIRSGLGVRSYDAENLRTARLVPLLPQVPLGSAAATGDLLPLAARIAIELESFNSDRNLFYADQRGGRFVLAAEPLEWGARYRLLTREVVEPPLPLVTALGWAARPKLADWQVYEFALPSVFASFEQDMPAQITAFFARKIRAARPRVFVVHPSPHHIDFDGTYVYPNSPESILICRTSSKPVVAVAMSETAACAAFAISDEWIRLEGLPIDGEDCVVSIDGDEQVVIRVESCELFRPRGVVARCGFHSWDMTAEAPCDPEELYRQKVVAESPRERVVAYLSRLNPAWQVEQLVMSREAGEPKAFRAGNFGELLPSTTDWPTDDSKPAESKASEAHSLPGRTWIEGLVACAHGQAGLTCVRNYLADTDRKSVHHLGFLLSSPLMPYIQAAHDQTHKA